MNVDAVASDQQLSTGFVHAAGVMLEIERGKIVRRVEGNGIQFSTARFWKSLVALGDTNTVRTSDFTLQKGQPWRGSLHSVAAPAGLVKDIDVIATQIQL
jgi:predicted Zn-dependent protease